MSGMDRIAINAYKSIFVTHHDTIVDGIMLQGVQVEFGIPGTSVFMIPQRRLSMSIVSTSVEERPSGINVPLGIKNDYIFPIQIALNMVAVPEVTDVYMYERSEAVLDAITVRCLDILYRFGYAFQYEGVPIDLVGRAVTTQDQSQYIDDTEGGEGVVVLSRVIHFTVQFSYVLENIYTPSFLTQMGL